ncbi:MAG: hypothetical protein QW666_02740 [Candidatus Woesearchaeota archaeon]
MKEEQKESETEEDPKETKKIRLVAIAFVIGFIIIFFAILFGLKLFYPSQQEYQTIVYHGFEFKNISGTWYTQWQSKDKLVSIALRYNPLEVQNVSMVGLISQNFTKRPIYITFDPLSESRDFKYLALAGAELGESLTKAFEKEIYAACTVNETEPCLDRPIVTCADKDKSVIFLNASGNARIIMQGNCLTLQGEGFELLRAVDKILYVWYKIIPVKLTVVNQTITNKTNG